MALAKAGADVAFIARGAHLAAMKSRLKVRGGRGETHLMPTKAATMLQMSAQSISCYSALSCGTSKARASRSSP